VQRAGIACSTPSRNWQKLRDRAFLTHALNFVVKALEKEQLGIFGNYDDEEERAGHIMHSGGGYDIEICIYANAGKIMGLVPTSNLGYIWFMHRIA
jgi:hypothetical protein